MTETILFMCPHNAAKSVLAAAITRRLIEQRTIPNLRVDSAGTHPDAHIAPAVASYLKENGFPAELPAPRKVTAQDLQNAATIVSLGCDLDLLDTHAEKILDWSDIPAPSADLSASVRAITQKIEALIAQFS